MLDQTLTAMVSPLDLSRQEHCRQRGQLEILHPLALDRSPERKVPVLERCRLRVDQSLLVRPQMPPE